MSEPVRGPGHGVRPGPSRTPYLVPCALLLALAASASGCRTVVDTVAAVFGPGDVGGAVDAHVVYRLRPDCPALLARTISSGYTVLTPLGAPPAVEGLPEFAGTAVEETGVFEGPVRTGEVVFRYVPPAESQTWDAGPVDVVAEVDAVRLGLGEGRARLLALCGPEPSAPDPTIPRLPALSDTLRS